MFANLRRLAQALLCMSSAAVPSLVAATAYPLWLWLLLIATIIYSCIAQLLCVCVLLQC